MENEDKAREALRIFDLKTDLEAEYAEKGRVIANKEYLLKTLPRENEQERVAIMAEILQLQRERLRTKRRFMTIRAGEGAC
jgi:hypothetical protein